MINGRMFEAQQGYAELEDVDKGTFIRFIRWAYNGIYFAAEFSIDSTPDSSRKKNTGKKGSDVDVAIAENYVDAPSAESDPPDSWAFAMRDENWGLPTKKAKKSKRADAFDGLTVNEMGFGDISPSQGKEGMK